MRALYFGTYDRAYPRNAQVISALRGAGVEVIEQHRAVWERRHNWTVGDLLIWDNIATQHAAVGDAAPGEPRTLHRVTIGGTAPSR